MLTWFHLFSISCKCGWQPEILVCEGRKSTPRHIFGAPPVRGATLQRVAPRTPPPTRPCPPWALILGREGGCGALAVPPVRLPSPPSTHKRLLRVPFSRHAQQRDRIPTGPDAEGRVAPMPPSSSGEPAYHVPSPSQFRVSSSARRLGWMPPSPSPAASPAAAAMCSRLGGSWAPVSPTKRLV